MQELAQHLLRLSKGVEKQWAVIRKMNISKLLNYVSKAIIVGATLRSRSGPPNRLRSTQRNNDPNNELVVDRVASLIRDQSAVAGAKPAESVIRLDTSAQIRIIYFLTWPKGGKVELSLAAVVNEETTVVGYTKYYYAGSELVAFNRSSDYEKDYGTRFVFNDHPSASLRTSLVSTSVIINGVGEKLWEERYYPYGESRYTYRKDKGGGREIDLQTAMRYTGQRFGEMLVCTTTTPDITILVIPYPKSAPQPNAKSPQPVCTETAV